MLRATLHICLAFSVYSQASSNSNVQNEFEDNSESPVPYALGSTYLTELALIEAEIYKELLTYEKALEDRLASINAYLIDYEDSTLKLTLNSNMDWEQAEKIVSHPIAAFRMIRRFSQDFDLIWDNIKENQEQRLEENIKNVSAGFPFPTETDHYEAIEAILLIHYFYDLNLEEFGNGNIMGVQTNVKLPPPQMFQIARYAAAMNTYSLAFDWLQAAELKSKNQNDLLLTFELRNLQKTINENHNVNFKDNLAYNPYYIFTDKLNQSKKAVKFRSINYEEWKVSNNMDDERAKHYKFLALCNGENLQSEKLKASLHCSYEKPHPYFYLYPLKAEKLSHEPLLMQFHQVISDQWINEYALEVMPYLYRAPAPKHTPEDSAKTAIYVWLNDEVIQKTDISRRIELITGLNVKGENASGFLQIASYAYGGYGDLHYDSYGNDEERDPELKTKGNRLATFLVYLNDVEKGGNTVFPFLGINIKPEKGSAVFWYTALKNGNVDKRMLHAACPVVLGHKWIATKWAYLNENFLARPCDRQFSV